MDHNVYDKTIVRTEPDVEDNSISSGKINTKNQLFQPAQGKHNKDATKDQSWKIVTNQLPNKLMHDNVSIVSRPAGFSLSGPITIISSDGVYDKIYREMHIYGIQGKHFNSKLLEFLDRKFNIYSRSMDHDDYAVMQVIQGCVLAQELTKDIKTFHNKLLDVKQRLPEYNLRHRSHIEAMVCYRLFFGYLHLNKLGKSQDALLEAKNHLNNADPNAWTAKVHHMDAVMNMITANRLHTNKHAQKKSILEYASKCLRIACEQCLLHAPKDTELPGYYRTYFSMQQLCIVLKLPIPFLVEKNLNLLMLNARECDLTQKDVANGRLIFERTKTEQMHSNSIYTQNATYYILIGSIYLSYRDLQINSKKSQYIRLIYNKIALDIDHLYETYQNYNLPRLLKQDLLPFIDYHLINLDKKVGKIKDYSPSRLQQHTSESISSLSDLSDYAISSECPDTPILSGDDLL